MEGLLNLDGAAERLTLGERRELVRLLVAGCRWEGGRLYLERCHLESNVAPALEGDSRPSSP